MWLMWPFLGWMLILAVAMSIGCIIINKVMMYNAPEDEEVWEPGQEHFNMFNADERIKQLKEG